MTPTSKKKASTSRASTRKKTAPSRKAVSKKAAAKKAPRGAAKRDSKKAPKKQAARKAPSKKEGSLAAKKRPPAKKKKSAAKKPSKTSAKKPASRDRILAVHADVRVLSLIRESLKGLMVCEVDTTPDATYAFELALQRKYKLLFLDLNLPVLGGEQLYEFVAKAYAHCHAGERVAPAVVYLTDGEGAVKSEIRSDARVKGILSCPFEIESLLKMVDGTLKRKRSLGKGGRK